MILMRPRILKFWEIKMKTIIILGTHIELHKSSPFPYPAAQVPILYYFPPHHSVFSQVVSCLESLPSNIFSGLHIFRFCHLCYITYTVFNYTANVPEDCNLWRSLSRNCLNSLTAKPDYRDQRTLTTAGFSWNVQYQPAVVAGSRSFLGLKANVMIICDVTMVFFAVQTISFTKLI